MCAKVIDAAAFVRRINRYLWQMLHILLVKGIVAGEIACAFPVARLCNAAGVSIAHGAPPLNSSPSRQAL